MHALVNGQSTEIAAETSVSELLSQLGLAGKRIAVELNGEILPRSRHAECMIEDGDQLEIVHAIGGGAPPTSPENDQ